MGLPVGERRQTPGYIIAAVAVAFLVCSGASARAEWLQDATFSCSDPMLIRNESFVLSWLKKPSPFTLHDGGSSKFYAELDQKQFNDSGLKAGDRFTINTLTLDASKAALLKGVLERRANGVDFPLWTQQLPSIPALALEAGPGLVLGLAFSIFFDKMGAKKASIDAVSIFVADGGDVAQLGSVDFVNGHSILTEMLNYHVKLGNEDRTFTLYTCLYPAILAINRIKTIDPPINKKRFERSGQEWQMINADTGAVERKYKQNGEDGDYLYLKEIGGFDSEIRMSRIGGAIQMNSDGKWANLYSRTELY